MPSAHEKSASKKKERGTNEAGSKTVVSNDRPSDAPEGWLRQIKEAVKESKREAILKTILGSSVLATVLTTASSFVVEPYKTRLASESKQSAIRLQNQHIQLNQRRDAYDKLDKEIGELSNLLRAYVATCRYRLQKEANAELAKFAEQSWDLLTSKLGDVRNAETSNRNLNPQDSETTSDVQDIAGQLGVNLFSPKVLAAKAENPEMVTRHQELQDRIARLRESIKEMKGKLNL